MIQKPAQTWGQENAAVTAIRDAAATGKSAVETGGRVARGALLCGFGGLWLFGALGSLIGGSIPSVIGCGVIGFLALTAGLRAMGVSKAPVQVAPIAGPSANRVDYSRGKLLGHAGLGAGFCVLAIGAAGHFGVIAVIVAPVFGLMGLSALRKAFGDLTALRWDAQGVTVAGLFNRRTVPWSSVRAVEIQQINTYAYGVFKVASRRILTIRLGDGSIFNRKLALSPSLLQLDGYTLEGLALTLQAAQLGRPSAPAAPIQPPPPAYGRDAQLNAPIAAAPRAPVLPAPYGAAPTRPAFGRRGT